MEVTVYSNPARVWNFVRQYSPVPMISGMKGVALEKDGEIQAGVLYEGYTGHNIWMHVAAVPGKRWLNKEFLRYCFHYPFVELGCDRISGWVEASNEAARRFDEHLGFVEETRLKGAARDGGDVILYVMWRKDCRYV